MVIVKVTFDGMPRPDAFLQDGEIACELQLDLYACLALWFQCPRRSILMSQAVFELRSCAMAQFPSSFGNLLDGGEVFVTLRHGLSAICFWNITFGAQPSVGFCC